MKFETTGVGYESNFKPESMKFEIGDPSVLIGIVRDKLYSDKIRVFIQEYISNARDANREAGQPDEKMIITAPSKIEPYFKIRDFGPGLSPERVRDVFVKFGVSTKRKTDNYIGGFGIGAKSAWSYTDSFVVKSYYEKTETHYLCHLGTEHDGSADILFRGETDEPNGVEIQVQVKEKDLPYANEVINLMVRYWPQQPEIQGVDEQYRHIYRRTVTKNLYFPKSNIGMLPVASHNFSGKPFLLLDGIPYTLGDSVLCRLLSGLLKHFSYYVEAKTGELDVAASRESIELNDKYKAWVENKALSFMQELLEFNERYFSAKDLSLKKMLTEPIVSNVDKLSSSLDCLTFCTTLDRELYTTYLTRVEEEGTLKFSDELVARLYAMEKAFIDRYNIRTLMADPAESLTFLTFHGGYDPRMEEAGPEVSAKVKIQKAVPECLRKSLFKDLVVFLKEENSWVYQKKVYPVALKNISVTTLEEQRRPGRGWSRSYGTGKYYYTGQRYIYGDNAEIIQALQNVERNGRDSGNFFKTLSLKSFKDRFDPDVHFSKVILHNDEEWDSAKLKRMSSRLGSRWFILDKIPKNFDYFKSFIGPISEHTEKIVRTYDPSRVVSRRETGSARFVDTFCTPRDRFSNDHGELLKFCEYGETSSAIHHDRIKKAEFVVYMNSTDTKETLLANPDFMENIARLNINGGELVQLNVQALKYWEKEKLKKPLVYVMDWLAGLKGNTKLSAKEKQLLCLAWLLEESRKISNAWIKGSRHGEGLITDATLTELKDLAPEYVEFIRTLRSLYRESVGTDRFKAIKYFAAKNKKKLSAAELKRQPLYLLRKKVLRKYPMVPVLEQLLHDRDVTRKYFISYFKGVKDMAANNIKELEQGAEAWCNKRR